MKISILKANKSDFYFSSGIIPINQKNAIEGKREAKKTIFLIVSQAYQRYQDEKHYQEHKLLPLQQKRQLKKLKLKLKQRKLHLKKQTRKKKLKKRRRK